MQQNLTNTPVYTTIPLNTPATDVVSSSFASLHVEGSRYGSYYSYDSIWLHENLYQSPETKEGFTPSNPRVLYTAQGTLSLRDSNKQTKLELALDLCGNGVVSDEIIGTKQIRRWSDDVQFGTSYSWSSEASTAANYTLFHLTISDEELGAPCKRYASNEVAGLAVASIKTIAYDGIASIGKVAVAMKWDETAQKHRITFSVPTAYFSGVTDFAYLCGSRTTGQGIPMRYVLAEPVVQELAIAPVIIEAGDQITFTPAYDFTAYHNETIYQLTTVPAECYLSACQNTEAKIEDLHETDLIQNIAAVLLGNADIGHTRIFKAEDGSDITAALQSAIDAYLYTGGTVLIMPGSYTLSDTVTIPANVTISGYQTVELSTAMTDKPVFYLKCGATVRGMTLRLPLNYDHSAIYIGGEDAVYKEYSTKAEDIKIVGTTLTDASGASTSFTGNGIGIHAKGVAKTAVVYHANCRNLQIYNLQNGIRIWSEGSGSFVANAFFTNVYTENCHIGIYDRGNTTCVSGYTIQTKPNNLYGVDTQGGSFIGGHVYDLDLYYEGDPTRSNIGHPRYAYHLDGGYGFITDPVFTEYQGKYGYTWGEKRPEKNLAVVENTWKRFRTPNETYYSLKEDGTLTTLPSAVMDFNGLVDNALAFANERWTVTHNINPEDIISGSVEAVFNPHKNAKDSNEILVLHNRPVDNPYLFTVDFGNSQYISVVGLDFDCICRFVKMEAWNSRYEDPAERTAGSAFSEDHYISIFDSDDNRLPVVQSTWPGSGLSHEQRLRFSFANAAASSGTEIRIKNIYSYNACEMSQVYLPSTGGRIYRNGKITVDAGHVFSDSNELVSKKYVDDAVAQLRQQLSGN